MYITHKESKTSEGSQTCHCCSQIQLCEEGWWFFRQTCGQRSRESLRKMQEESAAPRARHDFGLNEWNKQEKRLWVLGEGKLCGCMERIWGRGDMGFELQTLDIITDAITTRLSLKPIFYYIMVCFQVSTIIFLISKCKI